MGQLENWKMTPLDALLCNNQLQILKTLVFFFPPARQRQMIFIVKLLELKQCLSLPLSALSSFTHAINRSEQGPEIFESIFPYCDQERQQTFRQMQNAFQMMKTFQQFSDSGMFDNLSEMMGGMGGFNGSDMNGSDMNGFNMGGFNMDAFAKMTGMNMGEQGHDPDGDPSRTAPSNSTPDYQTPQTGSNKDNGQLVSMLSSMMNPEQKELFSQYEAMLDDLEQM